MLADPALRDAFLCDLAGAGLRPNTLSTYGDAVRLFQTWIEGQPARERGPQHLRQAARAWLAWGLERGWSRNTCSLRWNALRAFVRHLVASGEIPADPLERERGPQTEQHVPTYRSAETFGLFLDYWGTEAFCRDHWREPARSAWIAARNRALFEVAYGSAARASEILGAQWADYSPDRGTLRVCVKGGAERLCLVLGRAARALEDLRCQPGGPPSLWIFPGLEGEPLCRSWFYLLVRQTGEACGLRDLTPHDIRRCAATHLLERSNDLEACRALLNHRSILTTARYIAFSPRKLLEAHRRYHPRERLEECRPEEQPGREPIPGGTSRAPSVAVAVKTEAGP